MAWQHRTITQEREIISLTNGHSQREISEIMSVSVGVVIAVQRKYHLVLSFGRSISSAQFRYYYDKEIWARLMQDLYVEQKLSAREIGEYMGMHPSTIVRRLRTLGFEVRQGPRAGRGRGPYNWKHELPKCPCGTGIKKEGERFCAACRKRPNRLRKLGIDPSIPAPEDRIEIDWDKDWDDWDDRVMLDPDCYPPGRQRERAESA